VSGVAVTRPGGKEAICGLLAGGAFLGEEALLGYPVRPHSATAMTATEVLVVAKASVSRLLQTQPAIAHRFIAHVIARNARLKADLTDQLLLPVERRLAHTLLALAGCDTRTPCRCALPDVSQKIIAEMVGTTRSRVNFFMGQFKKRGFVAEDDGVLAVDNGHRHTSHAAFPEAR
jgi:CRP-like cAMP-binding protein